MPLETPPRLEPWINGTNGKGFVIGDRVFGWAVRGIDSSPVHDEAWYNLTRPIHGTGITQEEHEMYEAPFYISPGGEVAIYYYDTDAQLAERTILQADDRLHTKGRDAVEIADAGGWRFGSARIPPVADFSHIGLDPKQAEKIWESLNEGWSPGKEGKGYLVGRKGSYELYTWATKDGWPHHGEASDILAAAGVWQPNFIPIEYIDPSGEFESQYPPVDDEIVRHDPRLRKLDLPPTQWSFSKVADFWEDQRRKEFPEDFEESELESTKPRAYDREEIHQLVQRTLDEGGVPLGETGKALQIPNGEWIEWVTDAHGGPHHDEVLHAYGILDPTDINFWTIDPDGKNVNQTELFEKELDADEWRFASFDADHRLGWDEGQEGKGIFLSNGVLHTWNSDDWELHNDYIAEQIDDLDAGGAHYLYIEPTGKVYTNWGTLGPEEEELIREADPRLYVDIDEGSSAPWSFGASATT